MANYGLEKQNKSAVNVLMMVDMLANGSHCLLAVIAQKKNTIEKY